MENTLQCNLSRNTTTFKQENDEVETVICKMASHLPRLQCVALCDKMEEKGGCTSSIWSLSNFPYWINSKYWLIPGTHWYRCHTLTSFVSRWARYHDVSARNVYVHCDSSGNGDIRAFVNMLFHWRDYMLISQRRIRGMIMTHRNKFYWYILSLKNSSIEIILAWLKSTWRYLYNTTAVFSWQMECGDLNVSSVSSKTSHRETSWNLHWMGKHSYRPGGSIIVEIPVNFQCYWKKAKPISTGINVIDIAIPVHCSQLQRLYDKLPFKKEVGVMVNDLVLKLLLWWNVESLWIRFQ